MLADRDGSRRGARTLEPMSDPAKSGTAAPSAGKRVLLAKPRGYCAGVDRAVEAVEQAL